MNAVMPPKHSQGLWQLGLATVASGHGCRVSLLIVASVFADDGALEAGGDCRKLERRKLPVSYAPPGFDRTQVAVLRGKAMSRPRQP